MTTHTIHIDHNAYEPGEAHDESGRPIMLDIVASCGEAFEPTPAEWRAMERAAVAEADGLGIAEADRVLGRIVVDGERLYAVTLGALA